MTGDCVPDVPHARWRRWAPRATLLAGAAALVTVVAPALPREQNLVFEIDGFEDVRRLDVTWTRHGESEPTGGTSLRFDRTPTRVRHRFSSPNGEYNLSVEVGVGVGASSETSFSRRVRLEGNETIVHLRPR